MKKIISMLKNHFSRHVILLKNFRFCAQSIDYFFKGKESNSPPRSQFENKFLNFRPQLSRLDAVNENSNEYKNFFVCC